MDTSIPTGAAQRPWITIAPSFFIKRHILALAHLACNIEGYPERFRPSLSFLLTSLALQVQVGYQRRVVAVSTRMLCLLSLRHRRLCVLVRRILQR